MRTTNRKCFAGKARCFAETQKQARAVNENGIAFSMDLLCAFLALCMIALVSAQVIGSAALANARQLQRFELEKNSVMLLDAIVKNRNEENPALGAAVFNKEKHRVEENSIDLQLLKQANPIVGEKLFLKKLEMRFKSGETQKIFDENSGKNCLGIERLVLVEGEKALLNGVVCVEQ